MVIVLIIVVILSVVITQFLYSTTIDERIAKNFASDRKNYYAARGAVVLARALLEKDAEEDGPRDSLYDDWSGKGQLQNVSVIGDVDTNITITDQERLININRLSNKSNRDFSRVYDALSRLVVILEIDPVGEYAIAERIRDYIDADEDGDFEVEAKNGPLTTIEEMLQIEEITTQRLYGYINEEGEIFEGLVDYIGLWGNGRININTASPEVLRSISAEIDEEDAANILVYRDDPDVGPFNTPMDLTNVTGMSDIYERDKTLMQYLTTVSSWFEVRTRATQDNVKKDVRAIIRRQGKQTVIQFWKERDL